MQNQNQKLKDEKYKMKCPICKNFARIRSSNAITENTKKSYYQCTNLDCCYSFIAITEIISTVHESRLSSRHNEETHPSPVAINR